MNSVDTIEAKQFIDPQGGIVESASRLADEVVRQLATHDTLTVDLKEMRGLSSSFFNVLLGRIVAVTSFHDFSRRVKLSFDSPAQELVFKRSMDFMSRTIA